MIQGTNEELRFWEAFVKTPRFLNDWCSNEKTSELDDDVAEFILKSCPENGQILDCGSGAVSVLHGLHKTAYMTATDLLTKSYYEIFDYWGRRIEPPISVAAEDLPEDWHNFYDIAHIRNALDHTQDPVKAYNSMLACVKPGGYLIIQGFENEGTFENWQGMHQWDISVKEEQEVSHSEVIPVHLSISPKSGWPIAMLGGYHWHKKIKLNTDKDWFVWIVKK